MKAIIKIASICIALMSFWTLQAANISLLEVIDAKTFHVSMEEVKMWTGELAGEVKVLNDMSIGFAHQDEEDEYTAVLTLDEPLEKDTEYSLLTVFGADGSIDFKTSESLDGIEILNSETDDIGQYIESIMIVDANSMKVTYNEELTGEDLEFKLLSDIEVASISNIDTSTMAVHLSSEMKASKNYIFMVLSLQDALSQDVELEEWIYNFVTWEKLKRPSMIAEPTEVVEVISEEVSNEIEEDLNAAYKELDIPEESNDLLDADIDGVVEQAVEDEEALIEEQTQQEEAQENTLESVALSATITPETGAETTLLIILTLFINTFYYFSRRKRA